MQRMAVGHLGRQAQGTEFVEEGVEIGIGYSSSSRFR